ncbi:MAG: ABC transporter permease [Dethiobacteria bacterium]|jgi:peptide/nickel transport system permease protein
MGIGFFERGPNKFHLLGTDEVGRDILARMIYGGRVSLFVGIASTAISVLIGLPLGLIAGYFRGVAELLVMRAVDIFQSFPPMVLILVLVAIFGPSIATVTIVIGIMGWVQPTKLIYSTTLAESNKEYIESARSIGISNFTIILKHLLPNVISPLWINMAFRVSRAMIMESTLSFLGVGVQPPQASWGNIIYAAQNTMVLTTKPWIWIPPGIALVVTVICINLIGEGIRDALDPKMKR